MEKEELYERALTPAELKKLRPDIKEMASNTRRATAWYNEAVWTAAVTFVEAAEHSGEFRRAFCNERSDWKNVMQEETPEQFETMCDMKLSAFQGGSAESVARSVLE